MMKLYTWYGHPNYGYLELLRVAQDNTRGDTFWEQSTVDSDQNNLGEIITNIPQKRSCNLKESDYV